MSSYVDVDVTAEALMEDQEVIEAIEKLGKATAVAAVEEFRPEIDAVLSTVEKWVHYLCPFLLDYRDDHERVWEDLEKLALSALLFVIAFFVLAPWAPPQRHKTNHRWGWYKQQDSWSSFHMSTGSSDNSTSETDDAGAHSTVVDEVQEFELQWSEISQAPYSVLVLPPSCKLVENVSKATAAQTKPEEARNKDEEKPATPRVLDEDNPAQRLTTYWRHARSFFGKLLTFDYTGAGTALMSWIQGIRNSRQTNLSDHGNLQDDNETTASSRVSEVATATSSTTVAATDTSSAPPSTVVVKRQSMPPSKKLGVVQAQSVMNGIVQNGALEPPIIMRGVHSKHPSDLSTVYNDFEEDLCDTDSKDENADTPSQPLHIPPAPPTPRLSSAGSGIARTKSKDALEAYRKPRPAAAAATTPTRILRSSINSGKGVNSTADDDVQPSDQFTSLVQSESRREQALRVPSTVDPSKLEHRESSGTQSADAKSTRHFFDSATTSDSLKRLNVDVGLPDTNGYVVGDEYLPHNKCTPLLVFVNSRSGPQQGHLLITQLRRLLNPIQIWDLAKGPPEPVLKSFCVLTRLRLLVCGGDGTVAWIVSALESLQLTRKWPPIAILPLGTGNDLARIHGWGGGYNNESLIGILEQISESYVSLLDRWEVTIREGKKKKKRVQSKAFFNYLGVGADAQAALQVHYLRESRPEWFFSRLVNKAWYGVFGAEDILKATSVNVCKDVTLVADGVQVPLPADSQGIIVMNIDSYAGGVPLWSHGIKASHRDSPLMPALEQLPRRSRSMSELKAEHYRDGPEREGSGIERVDSMDDLNLLSENDRYSHVTSCNLPSSCQDGILEIVSIRGAFHLGQIKVGLSNARRLCQCKEATIHIKHKVAVQVDGEPWRQPACTLRVKRKPHSASMLHRSSDDGGVETVMSQLLDWAEERKLVDGQVHTILRKEFSRRIESHTRQKRNRSHDGRLLSMQKLKRAIGTTASAPSISNQWPGGNGGVAF